MAQNVIERSCRFSTLRCDFLPWRHVIFNIGIFFCRYYLGALKWILREKLLVCLSLLHFSLWIILLHSCSRKADRPFFFLFWFWFLEDRFLLHWLSRSFHLIVFIVVRLLMPNRFRPLPLGGRPLLLLDDFLKILFDHVCHFCEGHSSEQLPVAVNYFDSLPNSLLKFFILQVWLQNLL